MAEAVATRIEEAQVVYDLKERTKRFALSCVKLASMLPNHGVGRIFNNQLVRSGTSVGANYRAAAIAQSKASFISKLSIALEEADEAEYWLELIDETDLSEEIDVREHLQEATELTKILAASRKRARQNQ